MLRCVGDFSTSVFWQVQWNFTSRYSLPPPRCSNYVLTMHTEPNKTCKGGILPLMNVQMYKQLPFFEADTFNKIHIPVNTTLWAQYKYTHSTLQNFQLCLKSSLYLAGIITLPFVSRVSVLDPYIPKLIFLKIKCFYIVTLSCTFTHFYTLFLKILV